MPFVWRTAELGNDAVMVFFVLSGFVIAYVADSKERTPREYFVSRFARLYSVVVPALLLTLVLDAIGTRVHFATYDGGWYQADYPLLRLAASLLFVNEIWFWSVRPFSNGPFWSLGYEFWFYVIFAAARYCPIERRRIVVGTLCLFVGPKILLLLPVWCMGVWVYHRVKTRPVPVRNGWLLFLGSPLLYLVYRWSGLPDTLLTFTMDWLGHEFVVRELDWSRFFISSYIVGILVALHFVGGASVLPRLATPLGVLARPIRYVAGFTFALYLFHYPLLHFFAAILADVQNDNLKDFIMLTASLCAVWALGSVTEARKSDLRRFLYRHWPGRDSINHR